MSNTKINSLKKYAETIKNQLDKASGHKKEFFQRELDKTARKLESLGAK